MKIALTIVLFFSAIQCAFVQPAAEERTWYGKERQIHYRPDGRDFVTVNGTRRFTRALYGTNTGFRVEAGDLPEFALYMPGMGGNLRFGIIAGAQSKWLTEAKHIKAKYRPGSMLYEIRDPLLGSGTLDLQILALADAEGFIVRTRFRNIPKSISLMWAFGGASGKRFSRDGDVGADPESSFYLHAENCRDNRFRLDANSFTLQYGSGKVLSEEERYEIRHTPATGGTSAVSGNLKSLAGVFPLKAELRLADASHQNDPLMLLSSTVDSSPVLTGRMTISEGEYYFLIQNPPVPPGKNYAQLPAVFVNAEAARKGIADRISVTTPDRYINTLGGALSIAADAIWEDPSYLHGAVAWRMRLNAWRGAYVADPLGWHDRARKHFSSYALSQVVTPPATGVVMDTALHLARHLEKIGTALFSDGYICRNPNGDIRAHHYDMNLVFVDQLLNHFNWTGDTAYVIEMWPLIRRHLAWEKRNFDSDGDGLYDAYAAIWASDALQYSGGGVTHSSAYNYRANKMAAQLAKLAGEDGEVYRMEAEKILRAVQSQLWIPSSGVYAEYKDLLGKKLVHPSPGLWTIYHAIDAGLPDPFQAYQSLQYIDNYIPHIPVAAKGFDEKGLYLLSTTNWQPYTWSINNVAFGENLQTSLAYWQSYRSEEAFRLWKSTIVESMYMSASPGGFQQLSFYDAVRGELYRDFADGIGVTARSLVEGLFGLRPDALHDSMTVAPGFPREWNFANLQTPDLFFDFRRTGNVETFLIRPRFQKQLNLRFITPANRESVKSVSVNGKKITWSVVMDAIGTPRLQLVVPAAARFHISIEWQGGPVASVRSTLANNGEKKMTVGSSLLKIVEARDPQNVLDSYVINRSELDVSLTGRGGKHTFFVKVVQGAFTWWQPVSFDNHPDQPAALSTAPVTGYETVDLSAHYNDKVTNIFRQQYLSPRPVGPTLQLPTQGIGNWCYPLTTAEIDDSGMRRSAGSANQIKTPAGVPFFTPSDTLRRNIIFTSQWDNYPDSAIIPFEGSGSTLHLLMAGSTNPMQSRITNGMVVVTYEDLSRDTLILTNPSNWWPIEQDYMDDGFAFTTGAAFPERLYLKEGKFARGLDSYSVIKGFSNRAIDGGAATIIQFPLKAAKKMKSLGVYAVANDVVIGLMAATISKN